MRPDYVCLAPLSRDVLLLITRFKGRLHAHGRWHAVPDRKHVRIKRLPGAPLLPHIFDA
jgi:hypothetical protein